ncbi:MAG: type II secretion system F family protein [Elusimicrobiota bacterium]|jgi:tight adherence protein B|nr:type II secretion system F family protein [Elusimicrobiota bacterium]
MKWLAIVFFASSIFFSVCLIRQIFADNRDKLKKNILQKISIKKSLENNMHFKKAQFFLGGKTAMIALFIVSVLVFAVSRNLIFVVIIIVFEIYIAANIRASKLKKYEQLIDKQVMESLIIIKSAIVSGKSIAEALFIVCDDLKPPLKFEFEKIRQNLSLGLSLDKTLQKASLNSPNKEFKLALDTIRISAQSGASISGIFETITNSASQRIALQEKVTAITAQGKMSGTIVSIVPFVVMLMMSLLQPDMMSALFKTFAGNVLLLIVVIMILTGSTMIRKITEADIW